MKYVVNDSTVDWSTQCIVFIFARFSTQRINVIKGELSLDCIWRLYADDTLYCSTASFDSPLVSNINNEIIV